MPPPAPARHINTHTHSNQRVRQEVRRSLFLSAGAMSCHTGLAPHQLTSQSSLWSPSRAQWFTCLGCQVLPSPSLMRHGCPAKLVPFCPFSRLALAVTEQSSTRTRTQTYSSYGLTGMGLHEGYTHADMQYIPQNYILSNIYCRSRHWLCSACKSRQGETFTQQLSYKSDIWKCSRLSWVRY